MDVAVIGAGQAGLATSYHLSQRGIEHVVSKSGLIFGVGEDAQHISGVIAQQLSAA